MGQPSVVPEHSLTSLRSGRTGRKSAVDGNYVKTASTGTLRSGIGEAERRLRHSEYAFSLEELPSLLALYGSPDAVRTNLDKAISAYRQQRDQKLALYPGVMAGAPSEPVAHARARALRERRDGRGNSRT